MDTTTVKEKIPYALMGLADIEGLSVLDGLRFCGSIREFEKFIDSFYQDIENKAVEIESAYESGDIPFFTIKVHALKTTARMIGAKELSVRAAEMEKAGKAEDIVYIDDNKDALINLLRSYSFKLKGYMEEKAARKAAKKPISQAELGEAFDALKEITAVRDYDGVEMILEELDKYQLPELQNKTTITIKSMLYRLEWDKIDELLK